MTNSRNIVFIALALAAFAQAQPSNPIVIHDSLDSPHPVDTVVVALEPNHVWQTGRERSQGATLVLADLAKTGGLFAGGYLGGLAASPFINKNDEWGFMGAIPAILAGMAIGDLAGGSLAIHALNKKYVVSSPLNATLGLLAHYAAGAGLMALASRHERTQNAIGLTAYFTAPLTGMAFYYWLGKPRPQRSASP